MVEESKGSSNGSSIQKVQFISESAKSIIPKLFATEPLYEKSYTIKARDFDKAGEASINVKNLLRGLNYKNELIRRVSICAFEAEMNVVMYGSDGRMLVIIYGDKIAIEVIDHGPGIENLELALKEGYSTASQEYRERGFGAGMGLPNIKSNADFLEITTGPDMGTRLWMEFYPNG